MHLIKSIFLFVVSCGSYPTTPFLHPGDQYERRFTKESGNCGDFKYNTIKVLPGGLLESTNDFEYSISNGGQLVLNTERKSTDCLTTTSLTFIDDLTIANGNFTVECKTGTLVCSGTYQEVLVLKYRS